MRAAGLLLSAGVLAGVAGHCVRLLTDIVRLARTSPWEYAGALGVVAAAAALLSWSLRTSRRDRDKGRSGEGLLRLCGIGVLAWVLVILLFFGEHVVPAVVHSDAVVVAAGVIVRCPPFGLAFTVPMFLLLSTAVGMLATGRARSPSRKWTVALVYLSAPLALFLWWLTV